MTVLAVCLTVVLAVTVLAFTSVVRSLIRQQARERGLLLDRLAHHDGRPFHEAPADRRHREQHQERLDAVLDLVASPEQYEF